MNSGRAHIAPVPFLRKLAVRVAHSMMKDNCDVYAAQMAFYFFFALFPCMLFMTTLLAYLPVPDLLQIVLKILGQFMPTSVLSLVEENLRALISARQGGLLSIGAFLSLWTGSSAVIAIMTALNVAFDIEESRTWLKVRLISVLLVFALSIFVIFSLLLLVFGPQIGVWIASLAGLGNTFTLAWNILRWPVILGLMTSALSGIYRFAPAKRPSWRETVPGAVASTAVWVIISLSFSFYVNNFGSYDKTYGSIGAVIVLLVWMYANGFAILLGGEINARIKDLQYEQEAGITNKEGRHMRKEIISKKTSKS